MTYTHFVFDIDGTLIDTEEDMLEALQKTLQEVQGRRIDVGELRPIFGRTGEDALRSLGVQDVERALELWKEYYLADSARVHVFSGIEAVLKALQACSVQLGILSSKTRYEYQTDFIPYGLAGYFEFAILAEDSTRHKPDPEPMKAYLRRSGAQAGEVLYIGDTVYDMQCANGAGVDFGLAVWGSRSVEPIQAAHYFTEPGEILKLAAGSEGAQG